MSVYPNPCVYFVEIQRRQGEWVCIFRHNELESVVEYVYKIFNRGSAHGKSLRVYKVDASIRHQNTQEKILLEQVNNTCVCIYVQQAHTLVPNELRHVGLFYSLYKSRWTVESMLQYRLEKL